MAKLTYETDTGEKISIEASDALILDSLAQSSGKFNMLTEIFRAPEIQILQYLQDQHISRYPESDSN
jgi:hypothetical protein